ncbi:MAG: hypothetical protein ACYDDA_05875 [Acidiferrobacteraceae bacterium]
MSNTTASINPITAIINSSSASSTSPTSSSANTNTLSSSLISDLGLASLGTAFLAPAIIPVIGLPLTAGMLIETALGSTGAGIEILYPQAYQTISQELPTIPTASVLLLLLGMTGMTVGVYMEYYNKDKNKKGKKQGGLL